MFPTLHAPTVENLATLAFQQFRQLPKTGKPNKNEWTILSAIVLFDAKRGCTEVVAIGCGTKCIGRSKLCSGGLILNDSHAEILARRAFLRYIYHNLKGALQASSMNDTSIFQWDSENSIFRLRQDLSFHFVSTQTPCGDACIQQQDQESLEGPTAPKICKIETVNVKNATSRLEDVGAVLEPSPAVATVYTGAKLIGLGEKQDPMQQKIGAVRTKPGRGDRTLSMSCSDKLARWNLLGVQGSLLDALLAAPIYFKTLNFVGNSDNVKSIRRAIYERFNDRKFTSTKYEVQKPTINFSENVLFDYAESTDRLNPSPTGLSWCNIPEELKPYEISVNGKRLGVTKKKLDTPHASLKISKYHLMREFVELLLLESKLLEKLKIDPNELKSIKYKQCKLIAKEYQTAWTAAKQNYFHQWTQKPDHLLEFTLQMKQENLNSN